MLERFLATPLDRPDDLRVLTRLDAEAAADIEKSMYFKDVAAVEARLKADTIVYVTVTDGDDAPLY